MSGTSETSSRQRSAQQAGAGSSGAVYGLGLFGALVFFWQESHTFGDHLLAILKALLWPAFLVYRAFKGLG
jgi:hypothetical protein